MPQIRAIIGLLLFFNSLSTFAAFLPKSFEASFLDVRERQEIPVTIKYQYPKRIYYEVSGDAPLIYVCNEEKTWKYTPPFIEGEKGELAIGSSEQFCYSKIFDSLSRGLENNSLYSTKKSAKSANLVFNAKMKRELGIESIKLTFKTKVSPTSTLADTESMELHLENKENPVILKTQKIRPSAKFSDGQFIFRVPKNTNITRMN